MASSEEEEEFMPDQVTRYYFVDDNDNPISFAVLPFRWSDGQTTPCGGDDNVVLQGIAESGQQKVYKPVVAWKLELSEKNPIISVLTKEDKWCSMDSPRYREKQYKQDLLLRVVLQSLKALHFACKNPDASHKDLWEHLRKTFSMYMNEPSDDDLREHRPLIRELIKRHEALAKAKVAQLLVEDAPKKRKSSSDGLLDTSGISKFIVDDADDSHDDDHKNGDSDKGDGGSDESDDEEDQFDSVCAFCDNGGEILCCEGSCLRSFHATLGSGAESDCQTLKMSDADVKATPTFFCQNCKDKKHQCFACGKLGLSDKLSNPEVFRCSNATCGRFYHPECVAALLYPGNEIKVQQCKERIGVGTSFACPLHMCVVCRQWEDTSINDKELQFAVCRRCPKAYHRKCLPRRIAFEDDDDDENTIQRAWEDLLPNRILIYCLKHRIDENLGTPIRNHIVFPESVVKNAEDVFPQSSMKRKSQILHESTDKKIMLKKRKVSSNDISQGKSTIKKPQKHELEYSTVKGITPSTSRKNLPGSGVFFATKSNSSIATSQSKGIGSMEKARDMVTGKSFEQASLKRKPVETSKADTLRTTDASDTQFLVDSEVENRVMALMEKCKSSLTLDDIIPKHKVSSLYNYSKHVDRSLTHGKIEASIEAVKAALKMLEDGGSIEDAKAVCESQILNQILKWKLRLKVYLAPFIHGVRYSSFGRHFTKVTKLEEIVEMLHWYIKSGDMIVDFCCGANDFSRLLKVKLDETGKSCSFKNYDLIRPKNDFEFEKRDWMTVRRDELPIGSNLVMGLNPPFGVKAALANKFVDKALEFRPKLLVLIVPPETERLDKKKNPYDIIWEDAEKFQGKAFYLPGSVDIDNSDIGQWNTKAPVLYLWSRPDWTVKHQSIALKHGHPKRANDTGNSREENNGSKKPEQEDKMKNEAVNYSSKVSSQGNENVPMRFNEVHANPFTDKIEKQTGKDGSQKTGSSSGSMLSRNMSKERPSESFKPTRPDRFQVTESNSISNGQRSISQEKTSKAFKTQRTANCEGVPQSILTERTSEVFRSPVDQHEEGTRSMSISGEEPLEAIMSPGILDKSSLSETEARFRGPQNNVMDDEFEDIERRYSRINSSNMFPMDTSDFQIHSRGYMNSSREQEYAYHSFPDRSHSFLRENNDENFQTGNLPKSPTNIFGDRYARPDFDVRQQQVRMYGSRHPNDFAPHRGALDQDRPRVDNLYSATPPVAATLGSSSYSQSTASVIHRYAPRLDELNHSRQIVYPPANGPDRGNQAFGSMMDMGPRSGFQQDPMHSYPYPRRNSSGGWIKE